MKKLKDYADFRFRKVGFPCMRFYFLELMEKIFMILWSLEEDRSKGGGTAKECG